MSSSATIRDSRLDREALESLGRRLEIELNQQIRYELHKYEENGGRYSLRPADVKSASPMCANDISNLDQFYSRTKVSHKSKLKFLVNEKIAKLKQNKYVDLFVTKVAKQMNEQINHVRSRTSSLSRSSSQKISSHPDFRDVQANKHVMFVDSLGCPLELVHDINKITDDKDADLIEVGSQTLNLQDEQVHNLLMIAPTSHSTPSTSLTNSYEDINEAIKSSKSFELSNLIDYCNNNEIIDGFSYDRSKEISEFNYHDVDVPVKTLIPKFTLKSNECYQKLIQCGICLNKVEIYNQSSIRGSILTLINKKHLVDSFIQINPNGSDSQSDSGERLSYSGDSSESSSNCSDQSSKLSSRSLSTLNRAQLKEMSIKMKSFVRSFNKKLSHHKNSNMKLDIVYVIWSLDDWNTFKMHATIQNTCKLHATKGKIRSHEFFIQNLDDMLEVGKSLSLMVCHQVDSIVFKDTNNERCYNFECASRV